MMDEADTAATADACERFWEAGKAGKWEEAAAAYKDLHVLIDDQLEGEEPKEEPKEKRPLAAILIGGPKK
jgi:hypothetical protein